MSSPLTDAESTTLRHDGEFIMINFIPLTLATIVWTAYSIITYRAICILSKNGIEKSRPRKIMLTTTILMFLFFTIQLIAVFGEFLIQVKTIMLENAPTLDERVSNGLGLYSKFQLVDTILFQIQAIVGDAVVIWRTWAVWGKRMRAIIFPIALCVLSCISLIVTTVLQPHVTASVRILIVTQAFSAATNAVATGLISYKAWKHRRLLRSAFGRSPLATTQILQILILLVESGCLYLAIWLLDIIISVVAITTYGPWVIAANSIDSIISQILGLYPTVVIILVEQHKTVWDDPALSGVISVLQFGPDSGSHADSDDQSALQSNPNGISGDGRKNPLISGEKRSEEVA